jgi:hypothetical protein
VDSYLVMAKRVLERARRPMTPRQILRDAYLNHLVPDHLYGATQHKTLQARLSENIIAFRDHAPFFRTAPGRFFVRSLLDDESIPAEYRTPIVARRRIRDLKRKEVLAVRRAGLPASTQPGELLPAWLFSSVEERHVTYIPDLGSRDLAEVSVWAFVVVLRDDSVLTFRQGHYREGRDSFFNRRSVGFYTPIIKADWDLFSQADHGIVAGGLAALAMDLDLHGDDHILQTLSDARLSGFIYATADQDHNDLLGIIQFRCPDWFEPATRRLAMTDMLWHDLRTPPNHLEDFDPWSQAVIRQADNWLRESAGAHDSISTRVY